MALRRLITTENLIGGILVAFLGWLAISAVESKEAVASLAQQQVEDRRINEVVLKLSDTLPRIETTLDQIKLDVASHQKGLTGLAKEQEEANARLYCVSTFPVGGESSKNEHDLNVRQRADCITRLIDDPRR